MNVSGIFKKKFVVPIAIVLLAVAVSSILFITRQDKITEASNVVTYSTDKPDENKPDKNSYEWQGKQTDPKFITMPTINTEGFIQNVGVDQNKQIAVPSNIHVAGWFNQTVLPGEKGLSIIDGHVTGRVNNGIFKDLSNLNDGDNFTIELGNGSKKEFKTVKKVDTLVKDSASVLFSQEPGIERQVNLITCSGVFDRKSQSYPNRLIVIAKAI